MRGLVLVLFTSIPLFGGTVDTSAVCDGVTDEGGDASFCGGADASAQAQASLSWPMSVYVAASTQEPVWGVPAGSSSATASLTWDFILTVTGGYGDGYAEPEFAIGSDSYGGVGWSEADISLGGCSEGSAGGSPGGPCPWTSVPLVFGVPQTLTLGEYAIAGAGSYFYGVPQIDGGAQLSGFLFFNAYGFQLSGITYTFVPITATPEPRTLPLLTAMACAAFIAFKRRRGSRDRKAARPAR